ncbi:acyltransferase family protein [Alteromonas gracilis]|uniref:acyltransferase family protein n=1 Tax=Alteromonas gracilis TaxID=1479524 RepID=UPI002FE1CE89
MVEINQPQRHTTPERIDYLDGWRGLAISLVLLEHFLGVYNVNVGRLGVDIFFVLSGMLMANILFIKRPPLSVFYKRRFSRIFPVFFVFVTSVSLASYFLNLSEEHGNYLYNLLFLRSYFPSSPDIWNTGLPIGHLWSLNVEEHSYVILSIFTLIPILRQREYIPLILLGGACIVIQYLYYRFPNYAPYSFHLHTEVVASHLLLSAGYFLIKHKYKICVASWAPLLCFALAVLCYSPLAPHWTAQWSIAPFLLAFCVNHLEHLSDTVKNLLSNKYLKYLGLWSFSIYLWQQPFYFIIKNSSESKDLVGLLLLLLAILAGVISFYFLENPTRKFINQKW